MTRRTISPLGRFKSLRSRAKRTSKFQMLLHSVHSLFIFYLTRSAICWSLKHSTNNQEGKVLHVLYSNIHRGDS